MTRIAIVSASVAAGHDGAARELARRLRAAGYSVDCHDFVQLIPGSWGRRLREAYRRQLEVAPRSWDWLLRALQRWPTLAALTGWLAGSCERRLLDALGPAPAVVVSTYPLATLALARLRRRGRLRARMVAYLTDPSVHRMAVGREFDLHLAMHEVTARQARELGANGVAVTAPVVRPEFRPTRSAADRARARAAFDLPPSAALVLMLFGSWGVGQVEASVCDVLDTGAGLPVVVCGHNDVLRRRLRATLPTAIVLGWVDDMAELMRACDVVVQNAGGLGALEAWATGLPVLTYRCLAGHGRTNAMAWRDAGLAPWVTHQRELRSALSTALNSTAPPDQRRLTGLDPAVVITAMAAKDTPVGARARARAPKPVRHRVAT
ncbi:MAG: glycosyltransferase [Sciscionella sp.]